MKQEKKQKQEVCNEIVRAAEVVHFVFGPGKPDATYQRYMCHELKLAGLHYSPQNEPENPGYGEKDFDLIVENSVLLRLKSSWSLNGIHREKLLVDLKLSKLDAGMLVNFNKPAIREGIVKIDSDDEE